MIIFFIPSLFIFVTVLPGVYFSIIIAGPSRLLF